MASQQGWNNPFLWNGRPRTYFDPTNREWRNADNDLPIRGVKPKYAWVWPKDGHARTHTKTGRFKDILTGKGPDMFITMSGTGKDRRYDCPTRARWSNWRHMPFGDADDQWDTNIHNWMRPNMADKRAGLVYDFRTRKYGRPNAHSWSNAWWPLSEEWRPIKDVPDFFQDPWGGQHIIPQF